MAMINTGKLISEKMTARQLALGISLDSFCDEFKHDETNRAWWTGCWYGRGLGAHVNHDVMSQPAREFIVKITELSLRGSDLLLGHLLLFMLTPPMLIPYFNRFHATLLCEFS